MTVALSWFSRNHRRIDVAFVVVMSGLFCFALAAWTQILPGDHFAPRRQVLLSGAMLPQAIGGAGKPGTFRRQYALMALSMGALVASFLVDD